MKRTYEIMFIVRPDVEDEDLDKLIDGLEPDDHQRWRRGEDRPRSWAAASWPTPCASSTTASTFC